MLTYFRLTTSFSVGRFKGFGLANSVHLGEKSLKDMVDELSQMDCVDAIPFLEELGKAVAKEQFSLERFEGFLQD